MPAKKVPAKKGGKKKINLESKIVSQIILTRERKKGFPGRRIQKLTGSNMIKWKRAGINRNKKIRSN